MDIKINGFMVVSVPCSRYCTHGAVLRFVYRVNGEKEEVRRLFKYCIQKAKSGSNSVVLSAFLQLAEHDIYSFTSLMTCLEVNDPVILSNNLFIFLKQNEISEQMHRRTKVRGLILNHGFMKGQINCLQFNKERERMINPWAQFKHLREFCVHDLINQTGKEQRTSQVCDCFVY